MSTRARQSAVVFLLTAWLLAFYVIPALSAPMTSECSCCDETTTMIGQAGTAGGGCPGCPASSDCSFACSTTCTSVCAPAVQLSTAASRVFVLEVTVPSADTQPAGRILSPPSPPPR